MNSFWQDLRYGIQMLVKHPSFTLVAVLTLALGVGANTALFSVVDALLLKELPVKEPDRLVLFNASWDQEKFGPGSFEGNNQRDPVTGLTVGTSFPTQTLTRFREQTKDPQSAVSDVFAFGSIDINLNTGGQAEVVTGQAVSGNYYSALGVPALIGRTITEADDSPAVTPVAVLSHHFWTNRFGGDRSVVGRQVKINNVAFTVIGVTPAGFGGTMQVGSSQDVSLPLAWEPQIAGERTMSRGPGVWWLRLMGRLRPGVTLEQAQAKLAGVFKQSVIEHRAVRQSRIQTPLRTLAPNDYPRLGVDPGGQGEMNSRKYFKKPLRLLFGVVGLVLLIACANVANLLLVRASSRRKEIAVRLALGASRRRLIRQLLTESLLLGIVGGGIGTLFAMWIKDGLFLVSDWGGREMSALNPHLDFRVLGFTFGLSLLTGIVFGIMPALRATRLDLTPSLKDTGRNSTATGRSLLSKALVLVQVSLSVLLLIGAGLLIRTLRNLQHVETGFNENNLLLCSVDPSLIGYKEEKLATLYQQLSTRLETIPGVQSVTFSKHALLASGATSSSLFLPGALGPDGKPAELGDVYIHNVRENFLQTMGIPLLLGRDLTAQDDSHAPPVAVVNQSFAKKYFPNENPIGKRFGFDNDKPGEIEIVGLARDAKYTSQRDDTPPTTYQPWAQSLMRSAVFEIRTNGDPASFSAAVRQAVHEVDSNLPLTEVKTQIEQADQTLSMERMLAKLLTLFGVIAQLLAAVGLYGVMAYSVSQRTQEIGIRMTLGANRANVLNMILREGVILTFIGVVLGLSGAYALTKYLESLTSMLFGVEPRDPWTFVVIAIVLTTVALIACLVPARRATRIDPLVALRYE